MSVDPLAEQFAGWTPYHYVHNNPINLIDPTGMAADGWRENKETGEKTFSKDYTKANTPKEFNYADEILSGSEGKYYDSSGGITDVGTVLPEIEMTKKSSLHPYYNAVPSGEYGPSSIKIESNNPYINGSLNIASGIIGATGSIAYIGGTSGAGAVAGGALALTLSFSQINIGMAQIADGINGGNNKNLQMSSSLPGYAARQMNSPYAGIIDAGAGVLTGSLQGPALMGNIGQVSRSLQNISAGKNTYYNSYLLYSTGSSYYNFYNSAKKTSN